MATIRHKRQRCTAKIVNVKWTVYHKNQVLSGLVSENCTLKSTVNCIIVTLSELRLHSMIVRISERVRNLSEIVSSTKSVRILDTGLH
jgi:hypothetical protein